MRRTSNSTQVKQQKNIEVTKVAGLILKINTTVQVEALPKVKGEGQVDIPFILASNETVEATVHPRTVV